MKITDIKTYILPGAWSEDQWIQTKPFLFVKVETDEGVHGWGEVYTLNDQTLSTANAVAEVGRYLIGRDPRNVRKFAARQFYAFAEQRMSLTNFCVQSGLEMALWDIAGKCCGLPVHQMLGGALRERVELYANFWSRTPHPSEAIAEKAAEFREKGFSAIKIYPMLCPTLDEAERRVRLVREAIGPETRLALDFSGAVDPVVAIQAVRRFAPYDPYWIEDPVATHDIDTLARLKAEIPQRVVTGERLSGSFVFRELLEKRAADTLNHDTACCGGILTTLEIAEMAHAFSVTFSPHNYNSMAVGMAAMLQVSALAPNFLIAEYFPYFQPVSDSVSTSSFEIVAGSAGLPTAPGIGIDLDEAALKAKSFEGEPLRSIDL